jgi:acetyltransferase-like isoleucine patch superfamily enzyme
MRESDGRNSSESETFVESEVVEAQMGGPFLRKDESEMYVPLEEFTTAVRRLGELRKRGLVNVKVKRGGAVVLVIDKAADGLPPKGGGLYAEVMDVMSAIASDTSVEDFVRARGIPGPDFELGENESVSQAKYEAALAAFPRRWVKGGFSQIVRTRLDRWIVAALIRLGKRSGRLSRMMGWHLFRRLLGPDGRRLAWNSLGARIDDTAWIGAGVWMLRPKKVSVGGGSKLGGRIAIESHDEVSIGRNVLMDDVDLFAAQHDLDHPGLKGEREAISIGDYAWLPRKIIILPGVRIGSHAVVGTGSVVSKDVPDYAVAVGNPARVVKERARIKYTYVPATGYRPPLIK